MGLPSNRPVRLLNASTLELEDAPSEAEYVALSHTWADEEVSYQDLQNHTHKTKAGWSKIVRACERALQGGYKYIWVDTCCIDKSRDGELAEAINSVSMQ